MLYIHDWLCVRMCKKNTTCMNKHVNMSANFYTDLALTTRPVCHSGSATVSAHTYVHTYILVHTYRGPNRSSDIQNFKKSSFIQQKVRKCFDIQCANSCSHTHIHHCDPQCDLQWPWHRRAGYMYAPRCCMRGCCHLLSKMPAFATGRDKFPPCSNNDSYLHFNVLNLV